MTKSHVEWSVAKHNIASNHGTYHNEPMLSNFCNKIPLKHVQRAFYSQNSIIACSAQLAEVHKDR
jgi:hypothetical protein